MAGFLTKASLVALLAALSSGLPMALLLSWEMDTGLRLPMFLNFMVLAFAGAFVIGLPISLVTFRLVQDKINIQIWTILLLANVCAVFLTLFCVVLAGVFGAIFYGLPIIIAANVFAIAGWFILLKPLRESSKEVL